MMEEDAVVGVTSNPTIFQKAISEGDAYDEQFREVLAEEDDPKEVFLRLAVQDVQNACDLLRPSGTAARARTATSRSRSTRTSPTTRRDDCRSAAAARARRQAELAS
jgi:transaldolase